MKPDFRMLPWAAVTTTFVFAIYALATGEPRPQTSDGIFSALYIQRDCPRGVAINEDAVRAARAVQIDPSIIGPSGPLPFPPANDKAALEDWCRARTELLEAAGYIRARVSSRP